MELTLSTDDLARMTAAAHVLAAPLAYSTPEDWYREVLGTVAAFVRADSGIIGLSTEARAVIGHNADDEAEAFFESILGPSSRPAPLPGIPSLDELVAHTRCEHPRPQTRDSADRALAETGGMSRSAWVHDVLRPAGVADLVALRLTRPTVDVVCSFFGHHLPPEKVAARLAPLNPGLASGLDTLDRAGAHRAALDALDVAAAFFDADGHETHRTPALARVCGPDAGLVGEALDGFARQARPHAFARRADAAVPAGLTVHVRTPRAAYVLRATRLAPGALRGTDAFLVTVAADAAPAALPTAEVLRQRYRLTRRESDVAWLVARGQSNATIADALSVSRHTVRHHVEAVMSKLGLSGQGRETVAATLVGLAA